MIEIKNFYFSFATRILLVHMTFLFGLTNYTYAIGKVCELSDVDCYANSSSSISTGGQQHPDEPVSNEVPSATRPPPRATPPTANPTTPTPADVVAPSQACQQRYQAMLADCRGKVSAADRYCDSKQDEGMNGVMSKGAQIATVLGSITASNVSSSCSKIAGLAQAANAAVAAYRLNCANSVRVCKNVCQEAIDFAGSNMSCIGEYSSVQPEVDGAAQGCEGFDTKIDEANQAISNYATTTANASQCNLESKAEVAYCEQNPTALGCEAQAAADCSDPTQATTNKVCICAANPYALECTGSSISGANVKPTGGADFSSRTKSADGGYNGEDIPGLPSIEHSPLNKRPGQDIGGRQGAGNPVSGLSGGGGSGAGAGGGGYGPPVEPNGAAVNSGFYGGSGRFGGSAGGGAGGVANGSGGSYGSANRGYASTANQKSNTPDLRKFLPGGAFDPRRLNGGVTGKDGITGPHTSIWTKISNRYRVMSPTLLP